MCLSGPPLLTAYHSHWLHYQKGAQFINNLFSYFNRVCLKKYALEVDVVDYPIPGLVPVAKVTTADCPVLIRQVSYSVCALFVRFQLI